MDSIQLDGKSRPRQAFVYIMLNKPAGVVSASSDRRERTVVDLVRGAYPRRELFPAGRLDKTSTGFVLITDDGGFAHDILAPKRHVPKTYRVTLDTPLTGEMAEGFAAGVVLMDKVRLAPAEVTPLSEDKRTVRVVLHQGVYHQIKRMFGVYGAGRGGGRAAPGGHRRGGSGRGAGSRSVAGADRRRSGRHRRGVRAAAFTRLSNKHHILPLQ